MRPIRLLIGISIFWLPLSMLSDGVNALILPFYLFGLVGEAQRATTLGLLTFIGILLGMLVQPIAGLASDRLRPRRGRRGTIALGLVLTLGSLALFGIAATLLVALLAYLLVQVTANVAQAGQQGFIPDLVPSERRGTASGLKTFMDIGGALLGFLLIGASLAAGQPGTALLTLGVALLVGFLLTLLLVREPPLPPASARERVPFAGAFRLDLSRHRAFAWLIFARFFFLLGTFAVGRFLFFFLADRFDLGAEGAAAEAGLVLAVLALITVSAAMPAGWAADRWGRQPLMLAGASLGAAGILLLIPAASLAQILLFGALLSVGNAAFVSANWAATADLVPRAEAARFFGLANFGTAGAAAAAGLFGPLVDWANGVIPGSGFPALFLASALALGASAVAMRATGRDKAEHVPRTF